MKEIEIFQLKDGRSPFLDWLNNLSEETQGYLLRYINRVAEGGSKKNIKGLGGGLFEIRIPRGPAYRIYFGQLGNVVILIIQGGDKGTQKHDIKKAREYWRLANVSK